jgi:hypothetical protein
MFHSPNLAVIAHHQKASGGTGIRTMAHGLGWAVKSALVAWLALGFSSAAHAAPPVQPDTPDKAQLKACEKAMCTMVTKKDPKGADLACKLSRTWTKDQIKDGVKKKQFSWGLGDARCTLDVSISRAAIINAMIKPEQVLDFGPHAVKCVAEKDGKDTPINVNLSPKVAFKAGKAVSATLSVKEIEAPGVIKTAIWSAATLNDKIGIFQKDILKAINEFTGPKCAEVMSGK